MFDYSNGHNINVNNGANIIWNDKGLVFDSCLMPRSNVYTLKDLYRDDFGPDVDDSLIRNPEFKKQLTNFLTKII